MSSEQTESFWQAPLSLHLASYADRCVIDNLPPQWHRHLFFEVGFVLAGACDWGIGHQVVRVNAGEVIVVPPGQRHCERALREPYSTIAWLGFDQKRPTPPWVNLPIPLGEEQGEVHDAIRLIIREQALNSPFSAERISLLTQNILLLIARSAAGPEAVAPLLPASSLNARQQACVESAAHYFRQNLADCLSIAQVAAYHSLCPTYFSELFQRHHGIGPRSYLQRVRLEKAAALLADATLSIKEIARQCGFADSAHFCKVFRSHSRHTPTDYRKIALKGLL